MNQIRALIVDDEASMRNILSSLLQRHCPQVEVLGAVKNVPEAVEAVKALKPDLLFLDIEMPNYAGYEIVRFFEQVDFEIVFVTAYDNYAVRAFELSAVDYLLKPVDITRLKQAVERAGTRLAHTQRTAQMAQLAIALKGGPVQNLIVAEKGMQHVIPIADIIAIEAEDSYSTIHHGGKRLVVSKNLGHFESTLGDHPQMFRTHKSWIVNLTHLVRYAKTAGEVHLSGGLVAKLSKYRITEFEARL